MFVKLRDWRKETAVREAVPVYTVFMNEQLAAMVQNKVSTKAGLRDQIVYGSTWLGEQLDDRLHRNEQSPG